jgi:hypothetical protein
VQAFTATNDAACAVLMRGTVKNVNVKRDNCIHMIKICISDATTKLEASGIKLHDSVPMLKHSRTTEDHPEKTEKVRRKWDAKLQWNPGYFSIKALSKYQMVKKQKSCIM